MKIEVYNYRHNEPKPLSSVFDGEQIGHVRGHASEAHQYLTIYRLSDGRLLVSEIVNSRWQGDPGGESYRLIEDTSDNLREIVSEQGNVTGPELARQLGFDDITEADWG